MVSIIKHTYNISRYPSIVIEGEKFDVLMDKEKVLKEICLYYEDEDKCKPYNDHIENEA